MNSFVRRPLHTGGSGMTLIELVITTSALMVLMLASVTAFVTSQDTMIQNQFVSQMHLRGQMAMDRLIELSSQAVTGDAEFSPLKPSTGVDSHCLRFRLIDFINTGSGQPVYDDTLKVYLYGADAGTTPCQGIIVGRGPTLDAIHSNSAGPDGFLGTVDDVVTPLSGDVPAVELLVPSTFAPRSGDMLTINLTPAPLGQHVTFTMRLNARGSDGDFVLWNDLVLTGSTTLRQ